MGRDPGAGHVRIFPLPDVVLFPGAHLPLHVFEPRYRRLTRDSLAGDRTIGMVLLRPGSAQEPPPIFGVGCLGRIVRAQRLPRGRILVVLRGETRFRVGSEPREGLPYRTVLAERVEDPDPGHMTPRARARLAEEGVRIEERFLEISGHSRPDSVPGLRQRLSRLEPLGLVHAVAFAADLPPIEKQGVLERDDPVERARLLRELLDFRMAELRGGAAPRNLN